MRSSRFVLGACLLVLLGLALAPAAVSAAPQTQTPRRTR
jgi:hypothetical protein